MYQYLIKYLCKYIFYNVKYVIYTIIIYISIYLHSCKHFCDCCTISTLIILASVSCRILLHCAQPSESLTIMGNSEKLI